MLEGWEWEWKQYKTGILSPLTFHYAVCSQLQLVHFLLDQTFTKHHCQPFYHCLLLLCSFEMLLLLASCNPSYVHQEINHKQMVGPRSAIFCRLRTNCQLYHKCYCHRFSHSNWELNGFCNYTITMDLRNLIVEVIGWVRSNRQSAFR